ncbi:unnamed protein product, partial [Adineta steineri]
MIDNKLNPVSTMNSSIEHDEIDYFELIYECIGKRRNMFLNFIDLKAHS